MTVEDNDNLLFDMITIEDDPNKIKIDTYIQYKSIYNYDEELYIIQPANINDVVYKWKKSLIYHIEPKNVLWDKYGQYYNNDILPYDMVTYIIGLILRII